VSTKKPGNRRPDDPAAATDSAAVLRSGLALSSLTPQQLWVDYTGVGGGMSLAEVIEVLRGARGVSDYEHNLLAQALNDHFTEQGLDHPVAYAGDREDLPTRSPRGLRRR